MLGYKVWSMSDADFRVSMSDLVDLLAESFEEEEKPTYEEFRQAVQGAIEEWFEELEKQEVYGVLYHPPLGEGEPIYIPTVEYFMCLVEEKFGLKEAYEEYFCRESSPSM